MDIVIDILEDSNNVSERELYKLTINNQLSMTEIEMSFSLRDYVLLVDILDEYIDSSTCDRCLIYIDLQQFIELKKKIITFKESLGFTETISPLTFEIYSLLGEICPVGCEGNGEFDYIVNKLKQF